MNIDLFKTALSRFPSGVVIVTTVDDLGKPWGFTASSFSSASLDPPLVLVCLSKSAECHPVFRQVCRFAIHVLSADDEVVAARFAKRGADKFGGLHIEIDEHGVPLLPSAVTSLLCHREDVHACGDHDILVGRVTAVRLGRNEHPMVYAGRRFGRFSMAAASTPLAPLAMVPPEANVVDDGSRHSALLDRQQKAGGEPSIQHCVRCGSTLEAKVPHGDRLTRQVCSNCGRIHYRNPTIVVGCVAEASDGRVLMCRRAIAPRKGYWTFPSGFLECGESADEGARREALEEANVEVQVKGLLCVIDVPQINEVHLVYRAVLRSSTLLPTAESSEVILMSERDVRWESLAFTSVRESLHCYFEDRRSERPLVHMLDLRAAPEGENCDDGLLPAVGQ